MEHFVTQSHFGQNYRLKILRITSWKTSGGNICELYSPVLYFRQCAHTRTIDEYAITIPVLHVLVKSHESIDNWRYSTKKWPYKLWCLSYVLYRQHVVDYSEIAIEGKDWIRHRYTAICVGVVMLQKLIHVASIKPSTHKYFLFATYYRIFLIISWREDWWVLI